MIQELTEGIQVWHISSQEKAVLLYWEDNPDKLSLSDLWWSGLLFLKEKDNINRDITTPIIFNEFSKELKKYNITYSNNYIYDFSVSINSSVPVLIDLSSN